MSKTDYGKGRQGKKLSWVYRNKKYQRNKKSDGSKANTNDSYIDNKKARIIIRNLSFKATEADVRKHYEPYGVIEEINLLRHSDGKLVGCGFVQFKRVEDASKAIFHTNKKEFLGRVISSEWSISKSKFFEKIKKDDESTTKVEDEDLKTESPESVDTSSKVEEVPEGETKRTSKNRIRNIKKLQKTKKRARIIIRNLSFQVTEDNLKEHFTKYGSIEDVKILTRPDGKKVGCAFVQYTLVQSAAKAIHYANLQPLLGRPVVVDWAISKSKFKKEANSEENVNLEIKEEKLEEDEDSAERSHEKSNEGDNTDKQIVGNDNDVDEIKEEENSVNDYDSGSSSNTENESMDESDDMVVDTKETSPAHPQRVSNDVNEGRTVFLKNVPFSAKNEDLKSCMEQFGPIYYALICMDPLTEHSRGTAFVKFQNVEDAEKCLSAGTELRLHDQVLDPHKALNRNEVQDKKGLKEQKVKDSRNLYLVKEGVILAGSPAADGVSATDMARRLQLEQWKSQMLRNLNMFISRVRLVIHNLPPTLDDTKLRQIIKNHCGPKAIIKEARVMRDLRNVDANGLGKSKEYGFISFTNHEDALKVLRSINNNPNIFTKNKRPIVAFSIENRVMVNAKQKRIDKSRERNPLWTTNKEKITDEPPIKRARHEKSVKESTEKTYAGVTSKIGERKLRSKFSLKTQAALHNQTLKADKKKKKLTRKLQMKRAESTRGRKEIKPKQGAKKMNTDDANFNKLVNNYKTKLMAIPQAKSKWYEA